jgi:predicted CXXCH cytochrome family protein
MNTTPLETPSAPWRRPAAWITAALVLLALSGLGSGARAAEHTFSKDSLACLKCHEKPDIEDKKLDDGKSLSMHVSGKDFLAARHFEQDCTDCHANLDDKTHGKVKTPLKNRREMMASMQETCRDCHKKSQKRYDDSIHAALIKGGNDKAPYCANCHNAHTQPSVKLLAPIDKTTCAECHEKIFKAYSGDVHGLARALKGKEAPICFDCHQAHDVKAASLGEGPKPACLNCHKTAAAKHAEWLPNSQLHFEAVSCVACHSPRAARRVNLRLYDGVKDSQLREKSGVPQFATRVKAEDGSNAGLDAGDLSALLSQFSHDAGQTGKVVVRGRLEVSSGPEAHQLTAKDRALKDCDVCHREGAQPFKTVVLSIASADGRPLRHAVQQEVLGSATAFESVRGFYALGSTRIKLLDVLLVLAVLACIAACGAHAVARGMFSGVRKRVKAEAKAKAKARNPGSTPTGGSDGI